MYIKKCSTSARLSDSSTHGNKKRLTHPAQTRFSFTIPSSWPRNISQLYTAYRRAIDFGGLNELALENERGNRSAEHKVQQRSDQGGGENSKTSQAEFECIIYEIKKAYLRWFCKSSSKKTRGEQFREVQSSQGTANNINKRTLQFVSHSQGVSNITPPTELPTDQRRTRESSKTFQAC